MTKFKCLMLACLVAGLPATLAAQTAPAPEAAQVPASAQSPLPAASEAAPGQSLEPVQVVGLRDPARASYATLQAGAAAFDKYRSRFAPQASLRFQARPATGAGKLDPAGLVLRLEAADQPLPLALDDELAFALPAPASVGLGDAEVVSNRRAGTLRVLSLVSSPGLAPNVRRLGDLRLQCEVNWAIEKVNMSMLVRGALSLAGGICRSSYIVVQFGHRGDKLQEAVLTQGEQRLVLPLSADGLRYAPPMWDKQWTDDALITLQGSPG